MNEHFKTLDELVERLVPSIDLWCGQQPVPVEAIAHRFDVTVRRDAIDEAGRIEVSKGRIVITLDSRAADYRQRFTLAHELGHLLLARPDLHLYGLRHESALVDEEMFCERFAESLLMPRAWFNEAYGGKAPSLRHVIDCSRRTNVSLSAASIRATRVLGWNYVLVRLDLAVGDHWRFASASGGELNARSAVMPAVDTSSALAQALRPHRVVQDTAAVLPLVAAGRRVYVQAEIRQVGPTCYCYFDARDLGRSVATERPRRRKTRRKVESVTQASTRRVPSS